MAGMDPVSLGAVLRSQNYLFSAPAPLFFLILAQNNFGSTTLELRNATQKNTPNDGQLRYLHTIPVCGGGGGLESADLVPVADILSCCGGQPAPTGLELPAGHVLDSLQGPGLTGHGAAPAHTAVHHVQRLPKY